MLDDGGVPNSFLAAVIENAADDTPRLVYADWLEENGDPARAAFIRLQCELARTLADAPGRTAAEEAAKQLLAGHRQQWQIQGLGRHAHQRFRRGFVEQLDVAAEVLVRNADVIGRSAPVTDLLIRVADPHAAAVAAIPWLDRITKLDLANNHFGSQNRLRLLFGGGRFSHLRSLSVRNNRLWSEAVPDLAAAVEWLPALHELDLSGNPLSDDGLALFAADPTFNQLTSFVFRCDEQSETYSVHTEGAAALARSDLLPRLRSLNIGGHYLGNAGLAALVRQPGVAKLEELGVADNEVGTDGDAGVIALTESPHLDNIRRLDLSLNVIGPEAATALDRWPRLGQLERIDLTGCAMPDAARDTIRSSLFRDRFILDE